MNMISEWMDMVSNNPGSAPRPKLGGLKVDFARALNIPVYSTKSGLYKMAGERDENEKQSVERRKG